jgi:hypothetical protein
MGTEVHQAPSWSWVSIEGPINYDLLLEAKSSEFVAAVVDINCSLTESNHVPREQDENSITLRGRLMSAQLEILISSCPEIIRFHLRG